jgi:hypothetical protein
MLATILVPLTHFRVVVLNSSLIIWSSTWGTQKHLTFHVKLKKKYYFLIIGCVKLELYTNNFGGTKLKRNNIWGMRTKEVEYHWSKRYITPDLTFKFCSSEWSSAIDFPTKIFYAHTISNYATHITIAMFAN